MPFPDLIQPLLEQRSLTSEEATALMGWLLDGEATEAQIGGAITALRIKGVNSSELASFAEALRSRAISLDLGDDVIDTCGTGGGIASFNISTAAAFVAAGAGARIAKHGNRSVTSKCGSADVLEALGAPISADLKKSRDIFEQAGIVFLFAPAHHPGMKHVGKARKELGFRSVFNQLGPLANPARARRQMIGVYSSELVEPMAEALAKLGAERALVVHGEDGLDEISPCVGTKAAFVMHGEVRTRRLTPGDFGNQGISAEALAPGESPAENAAILREAISDVHSDRSRAVLPSASAAIWLAGLADDFVQARDIALSVIKSGLSTAKLATYVEASK